MIVQNPPFLLRTFYAAALASTLMLGNISIARPISAQAGATASPTLALDNQVIAARAAFDRRDFKALDAARAGLASSDHPLAPYATYWWLSANLGGSNNFAVAEATQIQSFLAANAGTSVADSLRRDWLKVLGNQGQWQLFNSALANAAMDEPDIICHAWRSRLLQGSNSDVATEVKSLWNAGKTAPDSCYAVFQTIQTSGQLSNDDIWRRVRLLLENKQITDARRSASFLSNLPANFERTSAAINLDAARYLNTETPNVKSRASTELYLFAVTRLARDDAARAADLLAKHAAKLSAADRAYAWAQVGLYGGMQHERDAASWFDRGENLSSSPGSNLNALNDTQAGWKARAALRLGDWAKVREAISVMSSIEKREPAWRYWLARSHEKSPIAGSAEAAKTLKESFARENNFYALLAAEELGTTARPNWQGYKPSEAELALMATRPGIQRVLALYRLDLKVDGLKEWYAVTRDFNDQELLAAAEVARRNNIPDRAISAADRTLALHDFSQRFPTPYRDSLQQNAKNNQLDEAWVYGLIRQESRFMSEVKSRVGAMGLMQLMPATATWAANQVGLKNFASARAIDIPTNLNLGTFYLRHVLEDLGHPVLATAAYNAGPGRARRWRAESPLEGAIYAETIPFSETRDYVKKVMANKWYYRNRFGAAPIALSELMGTVPGRSSSSARIVPAASIASTTIANARANTSVSTGRSATKTSTITAAAVMPTKTETNAPETGSAEAAATAASMAATPLPLPLPLPLPIPTAPPAPIPQIPVIAPELPPTPTPTPAPTTTPATSPPTLPPADPK